MFSLNDLPSPTLIIDAFGVIEEINMNIELLTGYSENELFYQPIELLVPNDLKNNILNIVPIMKQWLKSS